MVHLYSFYDSVTEKETFHIQSEWLGNKIELNKENESDLDYCFVTITNLVDYWNCKVTRNLLLERFQVSNALTEDHRDAVLTAALQGEQSVCGDRLEWRVSRHPEEEEKLQMKLRTYDGDVALTAGTFLLEKVAPTEKNELHQNWFKHCTIASRVCIEANRALQQRILDIEKTCNEYKETIEAMTTKMNQSKFIVLDKFTNLLNSKKRKTKAYKDEYKKSSKRRTTQASLEIKQEIQSKPLVESLEISSQTKVKSTSLPLSHEDDSDFSDDGIDCPQTVR
ncbi:hypothetical protein A0J61_08345 [Choanephora cucurbitarum]|uniref:DNA repair protein XRCC4 n=1 Tax=Choanephora cucurbitarum TaxID=101091 RepID=A0A1C7N393_9FUNG|nr:hypothetical protein A0J61_08345 [Choanephora cucurbitarum]